MALSFDDLEVVYDKLAQAIDQAGEANTPLMLAKLALWLANELENRDLALTAIDACLKDV